MELTLLMVMKQFYSKINLASIKCHGELCVKRSIKIHLLFQRYDYSTAADPAPAVLELKDRVEDWIEG